MNLNLNILLKTTIILLKQLDIIENMQVYNNFLQKIIK